MSSERTLDVEGLSLFRVRLSLLLMFVLGSLVLAGPIGRYHVLAWPAPRYECCCKSCFSGCFICRNRDFTCNCELCTCYNDHLPGALPLFNNREYFHHTQLIFRYEAYF